MPLFAGHDFTNIWNLQMIMISLHQVSFSFHKLQKRDDFLMKSNRLIISLWLLFLISSSNDPNFMCSFLKLL